jgi:hypothetical protein
LGQEVNQLPPSSAQFKNEWNYISTPAICFHGVNKENSPFMYHSFSPLAATVYIIQSVPLKDSLIALQNQERMPVLSGISCTNHNYVTVSTQTGLTIEDAVNLN